MFTISIWSSSHQDYIPYDFATSKDEAFALVSNYQTWYGWDCAVIDDETGAWICRGR